MVFPHMTQLRLVDVLPDHVMMSVPWRDRPVPVATVDSVEQSHPQHAEVLALVRERRRLGQVPDAPGT